MTAQTRTQLNKGCFFGTGSLDKSTRRSLGSVIIFSQLLLEGTHSAVSVHSGTMAGQVKPIVQEKKKDDI